MSWYTPTPIPHSHAHTLTPHAHPHPHTPHAHPHPHPHTHTDTHTHTHARAHTHTHTHTASRHYHLYTKFVDSCGYWRLTSCSFVQARMSSGRTISADNFKSKLCALSFSTAGPDSNWWHAFQENIMHHADLCSTSHLKVVWNSSSRKSLSKVARHINTSHAVFC